MSQPSRVYINGYYRRMNDSANNFTVTLPTQITNPKVLSINSATIPYLCYNFGESESFLYFQCGTSNAVRTIALNRQKLYNTINEFMTDLNIALKAVDNNITASNANDGVLTLTYGGATGGINVIGIENREYNWNSTYYNNACNRLGFYNANPQPLATAPTSKIFTGSGSLTLIRTTSMYVCLDCIAGDSFTTNSPEQTVSTILFQLPVSNPTFGGLNVYTNQDYLLFRAKDLPYSIYNVNVRVLDDNFDDLELLPSAKVQIELSFQYDDATVNEAVMQ